MSRTKRLNSDQKCRGLYLVCVQNIAVWTGTRHTVVGRPLTWTMCRPLSLWFQSNRENLLLFPFSLQTLINILQGQKIKQQMCHRKTNVVKHGITCLTTEYEDDSTTGQVVCTSKTMECEWLKETLFAGKWPITTNRDDHDDGSVASPLPFLQTRLNRM